MLSIQDSGLARSHSSLLVSAFPTSQEAVIDGLGQTCWRVLSNEKDFHRTSSSMRHGERQSIDEFVFSFFLKKKKKKSPVVSTSITTPVLDISFLQVIGDKK